MYFSMFSVGLKVFLCYRLYSCMSVCLHVHLSACVFVFPSFFLLPLRKRIDSDFTTCLSSSSYLSLYSLHSYLVLSVSFSDSFSFFSLHFSLPFSRSLSISALYLPQLIRYFQFYFQRSISVNCAVALKLLQHTFYLFKDRQDTKNKEDVFNSLEQKYI